MTRNKARKKATRARAAAAGTSYTAAHFADPHTASDPAIRERMRLTGASVERAAAMVYDARAYAARFDADDHSWQARQARLDADAVEGWERRRAGRLVRWWRVYVDVFAAAVDEQEACDRLVHYQRSLYHYVDGIPAGCVGLDMAEPAPLTDQFNLKVLEVPADELSDEHRAQLIADYPPEAWQLRHQPSALYGRREQAHIDDYIQALQLAATRLTTGSSAENADERRRVRGVLDPDTPLRFFRAQRHTDVLAGPDDASAGERGEQLAATVVDYLGRPVGRLAAVTPQDGFQSADGHWVHPAEEADSHTTEALWSDYDTYVAATDHTQAQAATLRRAAALLRATWNGDRSADAAHDAKLHTQPDGRRTLSTPSDFALVERETRHEAQHLTAAQLRKQAEHEDYLADRVYGKAVGTDNDERRIERLQHRARVLRALADAHDMDSTSSRR